MDLDPVYGYEAVHIIGWQKNQGLNLYILHFLPVDGARIHLVYNL